MQRPELLAPVGSWDALLAALANGADAVYMGGKQFSARAYASNFGEEEMERAVKLAHRFGAKVFVTVNTLLSADELETMAPYLRHLYQVGVDALIIQDLGLLHNLRALLPTMELHASTQMTVHNLEGAILMKELGISRVVLARELTYEQVKEISERSGVEIETFVHGALCFAYSGQCLMSSMLGGRSGNRGRCAQPCRLPYELLQGQRSINDQATRHQLSPRDMNQLNYLEAWVKAGISALKIEGRMKRPEYVATVVSTYRRILDTILEGRPTDIAPEDDDALMSAFNRRFTPGFAFDTRGPQMMSTDRPDNRGVEVGTLLTIDEDNGRVKVRASAPIHSDDQLELWSPGFERISIRANTEIKSGQTTWFSTDAAITGQQMLYRTLDTERNRQASASYLDWEALVDLRRVRLDLSVRIACGEPVTVLAQTADGRSIRLASEALAEPAQTRPITEEIARRAMIKLVDTPFVLGEFHVEILDNPSVPISLLNQLRRQVVEQLEKEQGRPELDKEWESRWPLRLAAEPQMKGQRPLSLVVAIADPQIVSKIMPLQPDAIYFGGESYGNALDLDDYLLAAELANRHRVAMIAALPRITTDAQLTSFRPVLSECERRQIPVQIANFGQLHLAMREYPRLELYLHWSFNLFNPWAVKQLRFPNVRGLMPSPELTLAQYETLRLTGEYEVGATVGGRLTLMISEHCLSRNADTGTCLRCSGEPQKLRDRYGAEFPVYRDQYCRSHILNSQDLCLVEHLHALQRAGITQLVVEGHGYSPEDLPEVLAIWQRALDDYRRNPSGWKERGRSYRMELEKFSPGGITKGHFFRGVE